MPGGEPGQTMHAGRPLGGTQAASDGSHDNNDQEEDQEDDEYVHALTRPNHRI